MTIRYATVRSIPADVDLLAVPVYAGEADPHAAGVELDAGYLAARGFEAKVGEALPLLADDGSTIVVVGLGDRDTVSDEAFRRAGAAVIPQAGRAGRLAVAGVD